MQEIDLDLPILEPYLPLWESDKRYFICMGGRSSGRSYAGSEYALSNLTRTEYFRCAIMRFVFGDIKNSIAQEIKDRIEEQGVQDLIKATDQPPSFRYGKNLINGIGFRKSSGDQKSKLKSLASYNCIIIEEADEVAEEDFVQLDDSLRTVKGDIKIIFLLNPPDKNHWIIKRWFNLTPSIVDGFYVPKLKESAKQDTVYIHGTYIGNKSNMNQKTIDNFERYKETKPDHYWNMIRGLVSEGQRGRVYKTWKRITDKEFDELPYESYYGLDFGYTNDPTALLEIKEHNNKVWFRELIYETGLTNQAIAMKLELLGISRSAKIYADSAEPKSIQEIRNENWNIEPSVKGSDSINAGIDLLLSKEVYYTESSTNLDIEVQEYRWALDKNKEPTNKPIDDYNHCLDAGRYGVFTNNKAPFIGILR